MAGPIIKGDIVREGFTDTDDAGVANQVRTLDHLGNEVWSDAKPIGIPDAPKVTSTASYVLQASPSGSQSGVTITLANNGLGTFNRSTIQSFPSVITTDSSGTSLQIRNNFNTPSTLTVSLNDSETGLGLNNSLAETAGTLIEKLNGWANLLNNSPISLIEATVDTANSQISIFYKDGTTDITPGDLSILASPDSFSATIVATAPTRTISGTEWITSTAALYTFEDEGTAIPSQTNVNKINFKGSGVTAALDTGDNTTVDITVTAGSTTLEVDGGPIAGLLLNDQIPISFDGGTI